MASELDLPYACVPAGTRNHFASTWALIATTWSVPGRVRRRRERRVDLAEVNGRIFVNNVSLGLYAEQSRGPVTARPSCAPAGHRAGSGGSVTSSTSPGVARRPRASIRAAVWSRTIAIGSAGPWLRDAPRIDDGLLGSQSQGAHRPAGAVRPAPWREWSAPEFEVRSDHPVAAGIDGEA